MTSLNQSHPGQTFVIKGIISKNNKWVDVSGSHYSSYVYIDNNKVQQGIAGQVRHNGNEFEINDGNSWKVKSGKFILAAAASVYKTLIHFYIQLHVEIGGILSSFIGNLLNFYPILMEID